MLVIGRNVEVKIEDGQLTIVCQVDNVTRKTVNVARNRWVLARSDGDTHIPGTVLLLDLILYGGRIS